MHKGVDGIPYTQEEGTSVLSSADTQSGHDFFMD